MTEPCPAAAPASLRQRLRHETRATHADLEACLPISSGRVDLAVYRDHLAFLLGFHEPLERRLAHVPGLHDHLPDLAQRWKTRTLRVDLGTRDRGPRVGCKALPDPRDASEGLGVLYVLEGATLGARTLLPVLRDAGVIPGSVGTRYLRGYGRRTGHMWRRVCRVLDALPERDADDVVRLAHETFAALRAWRADWERLHG